MSAILEATSAASSARSSSRLVMVGVAPTGEKIPGRCRVDRPGVADRYIARSYARARFGSGSRATPRAAPPTLEVGMGIVLGGPADGGLDARVEALDAAAMAGSPWGQDSEAGDFRAVVRQP